MLLLIPKHFLCEFAYTEICQKKVRALCTVFRVTRCACEKIAQNVAQPVFAQIDTKPLSWKKLPKYITSVIFKQLPKVNIHPMGKSSPNLVTLTVLKKIK
jgi:hypothetical protein